MNTPIYCDCCGREKIAELRGDKLVITDRRHGQKHMAVITVGDLLQQLDKEQSATTR